MSQETNPSYAAVGIYVTQLRDYCSSLHGLLNSRNVSSPEFGNGLASLDAHLSAGKTLSPSLPIPINGLVSTVERYATAVRQLLPRLQEQHDASYLEASTLMTRLQGVIEGYESAQVRPVRDVPKHASTQSPSSSDVTPPYTATGKAERPQPNPVDSGGPKRRRGRPPKSAATKT